jgi:hypothetical protein
MTGVVTSTRTGKCVWSYMTGVISSNRSRSYDQSRVLRLESGIRPESCLLTGFGQTTGVAPSYRSQAYDQSRDILAL